MVGIEGAGHGHVAREEQRAVAIDDGADAGFVGVGAGPLPENGEVQIDFPDGDVLAIYPPRGGKAVPVAVNRWHHEDRLDELAGIARIDGEGVRVAPGNQPGAIHQHGEETRFGGDGAELNVGAIEGDASRLRRDEVRGDARRVHRGIRGRKADEGPVGRRGREGIPVEAAVALIQNSDETGVDALREEERVLGEGVVEDAVAVEVVAGVLRTGGAGRGGGQWRVVNVGWQRDGWSVGEIEDRRGGGIDPVGAAGFEGAEFLQRRAGGGVIAHVPLAGRRTVKRPDLLNGGELVAKNRFQRESGGIHAQAGKADEIPAGTNLGGTFPRRVGEAEEAGLIDLHPVAVAGEDGGEVVRIVGVGWLEGEPVGGGIAKIPCRQERGNGSARSVDDARLNLSRGVAATGSDLDGNEVPAGVEGDFLRLRWHLRQGRRWQRQSQQGASPSKQPPPIIPLLMAMIWSAVRTGVRQSQ